MDKGKAGCYRMLFFAFCFPPLLLAGCAGTPQKIGKIVRGDKLPAASSGGYYQDDGPGDNPPPDLDAIPDAAPKVEPLNKHANNPYTVFGRVYVPDKSLAPYKERGIASWYGRKFHGQKTSSGEIYDMYAMTAAHPTLPIPSYARVTNLGNNKSVLVRINDRGPFHYDRLIDLSYTAAYKLGTLQNGSALVEVESINPQEYAAQPSAENRVANASRPAAEKTADTPMVTEPGGVYLQLGAFSTQQNAESFGSRIRQQLGSMAEAVRILAKDGLFRVNLGPYPTAAEAGRIAAQLRQSLNLSPLQIAR